MHTKRQENLEMEILDNEIKKTEHVKESCFQISRGCNGPLENDPLF